MTMKQWVAKLIGISIYDTYIGNMATEMNSWLEGQVYLSARLFLVEASEGR